ncbi:hypothetical protein [Conexivisphaera calida]|uniref:Uncharacterized protein n=1 Tax=Conexivisphaera calida TaxID=1874277 RepID=A0A4P2VB84_9ARCH|nr:hypothetical protein [Conexivisphaera calida]BBE41786.1 hypothetical protein NAS2_0395 [Conexivisphaera calida]
MPTVIMISWARGGGPDGDPAADAAALGGTSALHLYPWSSDGPLDGMHYPVAITVKTNTSMISAVIASLGDFARAISGTMERELDPCDVRAVIGYGWAGSALGSAVKDWLGIPLISSLGDSSPSGSDLESIAIRNLEMRSAHSSDVVVARTRSALLRVRYSHQVPADRTALAASPIEMSAIVSRYVLP